MGTCVMVNIPKPFDSKKYTCHLKHLSKVLGLIPIYSKERAIVGMLAVLRDPLPLLSFQPYAPQPISEQDQRREGDEFKEKNLDDLSVEGRGDVGQGG